jgi:hypothetical protein
MPPLKEELDGLVSDIGLQNQFIAKALDTLAAKLDADAGVTDTDYADVLNALTP